MAAGTVIKIRYSGSTAAPVDQELAVGELAYSFKSGTGDRLYIGDNQSGASQTNIVIGGTYFTSKLDHALGTLTANSAILVDASSKIDILNVQNITLTGNTISTTNSNGDLVLAPVGTGDVNVLADTLAVTGNLTVSGTTTTTGGSTLGNINITANIISATNTNGDIVLDPDGTGDVEITSTKGTLIVPKGTGGDRPTQVAGNVGGVRYNTTTHTFEGVHDTPSGAYVWKGIGGVSDIDQDTYITAETDNASTPQTVNNTIRFFVSDVKEMQVNAGGVNVTDQITSPIANIGTANVTTKLNVTTADVTFTNGIDVTGGDVDITANLNVTGNTTIGGNLTVEGTTTTVESTIVSITDHVMELSADSTSTVDTFERGVNFKYGDGSAIQTGFFGMDMGSKRFSFQSVLGTGDTTPDDNQFVSPWGDAQFNSLFLSGNSNVTGNSIITGLSTIGGTLGVTGVGTFSSNVTVAGTLAVTGLTTVGGTLGVTGITTLAALLNANGGIAVDTNKFTVADATGNIVSAGTMTIAGATVLSSTLNGQGAVDFDTTLNVDGAVTHKSTTHLGSTAQMKITAAGVMTHGYLTGSGTNTLVIDCGTF